MFKKIFAVVMCIALIASISTMSASVFADEAKTSVEGIRWFPCEAGRENDDLWEAECLIDGCGCQRFDDDPAETGYENFLDTTYNEDGSLTLKRNGKDGQGDVYWPRIRTLMLDNYPSMDWTVANTLYYEIEAVDCSFNLMLGINGLNIKLAKNIADNAGVSGVANSDGDAPAGTYKGSINLTDALTQIAAEGSTESATGALAIQNMGANTFIPQVSIFYVGGTTGSLTIKNLYISTADDVDGAKCDYADMGLILGDEWYEESEAPADDETDDTTADTEAPADTADDSAKDDETEVNDNDKKKDGFPTWAWFVIGGAAVAAAAVVVVLVVTKKK